MAGLPAGWEWDYDGSRWFYKYKPTGHVQYHFPTEGDEFPEFVDAAAPAPDLAPEERLESQQQVRRQTSTAGGTASRPGSGGAAGWKPRMTASARPVSSVWEDDGHADGEAFQPESFMFLGPGTYADVSPLAEEEEEAARRAVAGGTLGVAGGGSGPGSGHGKGVSPLGSEKTTPLAAKSEVSGSPAGAAATTQEEKAAEEEPVVHMLDGREMPHELPVGEPAAAADPVGVVAEMATEYTARAHAETHPDPVEMGDAGVLAPIETAAPGGVAELPERSSPVEKKAPPLPQQQQQHQPQDSTQVEGTNSAEKQSGTKPESSTEGAYRPYVEGQPPSDDGRPLPSDKSRRERPSGQRQRDASLMMEPRKPSSVDHGTVPPVLSPPKSPPRDAVFSAASRDVRERDSPPAVGAGERTEKSVERDEGSQGLWHVPSVLKPARDGQSRSPDEGPLRPPIQHSPLDTQPLGPQIEGSQTDVSRFPSVLRPARGRTLSQTSQPPPVTFTTNPAPEAIPGRTTYGPPTQEQHPASMTPPGLHQPPRDRRGQEADHNETPPGEQLHETSRQHVPHHKPHVHPNPAATQPEPLLSATQSPGLLNHGQAFDQGRRQQLPYPSSPVYQQGAVSSSKGLTHNVQNPPPSAAAEFIVQDGPQPPPVQHHSPQGSPNVPPAHCPPGQPGHISPEQSVQQQQPGSAAPQDVSPIHSRSASQSSEIAPSPPETSRRTSFISSISQSPSALTYTPSPMAQAPLSDGSVSPRRPASRPTSFSGTPREARASAQSPPGPPVPGKVPLDAAQESYFSGQGETGKGVPTAIPEHVLKSSASESPQASRRHSMPAQPPRRVTQQPRGPPQQAPDASSQASLSGPQRTQSLHQTPSPTQTPPRPIQSNEDRQERQMQPPPAPPPGHTLSRIEEHEEPQASASNNSSQDGTVTADIQRVPATREQSVQSLVVVEGSGSGQLPGQTESSHESPAEGARVSPAPALASSPQKPPMQTVDGQQPVKMPQPGQMPPSQGPPQGHPQGPMAPNQIPLQQSQLSPLQQHPVQQSTGPHPPQGVVPQLGQLPPGQAPPLAQVSPAQTPPGQIAGQTKQTPPGQIPPGHLPPGQIPTGQISPGHMPLGHMQPGQMIPVQQHQGRATPVLIPSGRMPPGRMAPGHMPPGQQHQGQVPPGQIPPGQIPPGQMPPGQFSPGQMPPGQMPPDQRHPGRITPGQIPLGHIPSGQAAPGQILPGQMPPGQMPPGQMPPGQMLPYGHMPPQGYFSPGQIPSAQYVAASHPAQQPMYSASSPGSVRPTGGMGTGSKDKEKKWTRWFKSSKSPKPQSPAPQPPYPPMAGGPMTGPGMPNQPPSGWDRMQFSQAPVPHSGLSVSVKAQPDDQTQGTPPPLTQGQPVAVMNHQGVAIPGQGASPTPPRTSTSDSVSVLTTDSVERKSQPPDSPRAPSTQRKPTGQMPARKPSRSTSGGVQYQVGAAGTMGTNPHELGPVSFASPPGSQQVKFESVTSLVSQPSASPAQLQRQPTLQPQPQPLVEQNAVLTPAPHDNLKGGSTSLSEFTQKQAQAQIQQQPAPQPNPQSHHPVEQNMVPAPLFAGQTVSSPSHGDAPPTTVNGSVQSGAAGTPGSAATGQFPRRESKWAKRPAADYSGRDWGEGDDWHS